MVDSNPIKFGNDCVRNKHLWPRKKKLRSRNTQPCWTQKTLSRTLLETGQQKTWVSRVSFPDLVESRKNGPINKFIFIRFYFVCFMY